MTPKNYLVTGCSTGIGLDCALALDRLGHHVFAGIRKTNDAEVIQSKASLRLTPLILDITKDGDIERAVRVVTDKVGASGLHGLINNAGIVKSGPVEFITAESYRRQFDVNVIGQISMTQAFLPLLRKTKGRIVNIGSVSGLNAVPFLSPYSASKFALRAVNDCMRLEFKPWEISVSLVQPGPIKTPIWDKSVLNAEEEIKGMPPAAMKLYGDALKNMLKLVEDSKKRAVEVQLVTKAILHALMANKPKPYYQVGSHARLESVVARYFPTKLRDRLISKAMGI